MTPHDYWQDLLAPGTIDPAAPIENAYPAQLADGRQLLLPIRTLADGKTALASLIINQASFTVSNALAQDLARRIEHLQVDVIVGLPTLGLTLASRLAEALGHNRYVPLGNSRKFWYDEALSVPISSITTPDQSKSLYLDPRMVPLLEGRKVLLVDDVISSGRSILAGLHLLKKCNIQPVAIAAAMLQSERYRHPVADFSPALENQTYAAFSTPLLHRRDDGRWQAV